MCLVCRNLIRKGGGRQEINDEMANGLFTVNRAESQVFWVQENLPITLGQLIIKRLKITNHLRSTHGKWHQSVSFFPFIDYLSYGKSSSDSTRFLMVDEHIHIHSWHLNDITKTHTSLQIRVLLNQIEWRTDVWMYAMDIFSCFILIWMFSLQHKTSLARLHFLTFLLAISGCKWCLSCFKP